MKKTIYCLAFIVFALSCSNPKHTDNYRVEDVPFVAATPKVNYNDISDIQSLIDTISNGRNDFFLGFNFGMSRDDVSKHVDKLKTEIISIRYHSTYKVTYPMLGLTADLAPGYLAIMDISHEGNIGKGKYFLHPKYKDGRLTSMEVYSFEEWNSSSVDHRWLLGKIMNSYSDPVDGSLRTSLINNGIISMSNPFVGKRNNVIIYEDYVSITFYDYRSLMSRVLSIYDNNKKIIKNSDGVAI